MEYKEMNPLQKQTFLSGVRQKWLMVNLIYGIVFAMLQIFYKLDATPFINYALMLSSIFMVGASVDSSLKITKTKPNE